MKEIETIFRQRYNDYYVVAQEFTDGKFGVLIFPHNTNFGYLVETVLTRDHALNGAKKVHIFYDIAISKGYRLSNGSFIDNHGNELHASYAMDLDATEDNFSKLLV